MNQRDEVDRYLMLTILGFCCGLLSACGSGGDKPQKLAKEVQRTLAGAKASLENLAADTKGFEAKAAAEVEKLFSYEYRVEELESSASRLTLQRRLNDLGRQRWDCFHMETRGSGKEELLRVFCKRKPESHLRYVEKVL